MKQILAGLIALLLAAASCASSEPVLPPQTSADVQTQIPAPSPAPAPEPIPAPAVDAAAVTAAFYAAEATAALFTGYVGNVFADGSVEEGGVICVDVAAIFDIMDDPLTVTHTYTCMETAGEYRFTGEFPLPFTVVYDAWIGRNMK